MAELRIGVQDKDLGTVIENAQRSRLNAQVEPERQFFIDPISWILISGSAALIAVYVNDVLEKAKGGVLVDLRANPAQPVHRDKEIPFGYVIIIPADGSVKIEIHDAPKDAMQRFLENIVKAASGSRKDVMSAATNELGDNAKMEVKQLPSGSAQDATSGSTNELDDKAK